MMKFYCISNYFATTDFPAVLKNHAALFKPAFTCPMSTSKWVGWVNNNKT